MTQTHWIERTSPKGEGMSFVGTCPKCGRTGLTLADMGKPCENTLGLTNDETLIASLGGDFPERLKSS